ncbi:pectin lyase [Dickeya solani]|uniref:Pectate lyase n=2 Tax=Dickeya solani TaxID=1089444 RepID=A0AAP7E6Y5_9GAMM|nr:pectin lyase [Dickeya solani]ANE76004.1 pectate lyase [Dickeya solani IPO 2222]AUC43534.1 Pectin lyase [Dickeya solani RNS 08.23.3.1.A]AUH08587.1 pectate lyase [Dickeya solani D s0432-1]AUH12584.1 pectate lyase [Dickeya solani]AYQ46445.1 Pectin lyase [Dickeya solani]
MAYPTTGTSGMVGFAKAGSTTGGTGGTVVSITSLSDLKTHVAGTDAKILVINANISASALTKVTLGANKSIIGSYSSNTLTNIHFRSASSSKNIIFQNLTFKHTSTINGNDDIQIYLTSGSKYWLDHLTFPGHDYTLTDGGLDKLIYIGEKADYVTISNCLFKNHEYGLIFGYPQDGSSNGSTYDGYPHLTICHCYFSNIYVRAPGLMRYGYYHAYNNFIDKYQLGFTLAQNAKIVSEYNYFGTTTSSNKGMLDDKGTGTFTDTGSTPSITNQTSSASKWAPSSNYSYTLKTVSEAKTFTQKYAGVQSSSLTFGG